MFNSDVGDRFCNGVEHLVEQMAARWRPSGWRHWHKKPSNLIGWRVPRELRSEPLQLAFSLAVKLHDVMDDLDADDAAFGHTFKFYSSFTTTTIVHESDAALFIYFTACLLATYIPPLSFFLNVLLAIFSSQWSLALGNLKHVAPKGIETTTPNAWQLEAT